MIDLFGNEIEETQPKKKKDWVGGNASIFISLGASNHTDKDRQQDDYYATDPVAIDKLLSAGAEINHKVWECACGEGHLAKRLSEKGFEVKSTDLVNRGFGISGIDFLNQSEIFDGDILTNPPYKYAKEFVQKALSLLENGHKAFMFLKLTFLESKSRKLMFQKYPPKCVYVFSERCLCAKNGDFQQMIEGGGSAVCYAWFEFEKGFCGNPIIKWI
ncbi:MAG: hypothetical protein K6E97_03960 [Treponema sp.]|nr:hypothetical protein [Treponema sp.]